MRTDRRPGAWWWPLRLTYGAFFLHTALSKRDLDDKGKAGLHAFAKSAYPFLDRVTAPTFVRGMTAAESTVAAALLIPKVPAAVGGAGLTAFGAGLVGTFLRAPGMRRDGSIRPSEFGLSVAKDSWMLAAGLAVLTDVATSGGPAPERTTSG